MRWSVWNEVENILIRTGVKPILAVVPDNRDEDLMFDPPDANFWERVRGWQDRGWTIGLHGYQHRYVTKEAGMFGRMPISEFAGLPLDAQEAKLRNALEIFHQQMVFPELWVAPAHSFDENTIAALSKVGMHTISDGYALYPYRDSGGIHWVPQQVGRFRNIPFGVWTICHHINDWTSREVAQLDCDLSKFAAQFTSMPGVVECYKQRRRSLLDIGTSGFLRLGRRAGRFLRENRRSEALSSPSKKACETLPVPRKSS
jgi:peptidoglycan/xylan/chitin deacetylase (PgdA/CDA1 family)